MPAMRATQHYVPPSATFTLLHNLAPAHDRVFPGVNATTTTATESNRSSLVPVRPETNDDDSDETKQDMEQKTHMLRAVLGGWMDQLNTEELPNGIHRTSESSLEMVTFVGGSINGPLHYLQTKPRVLLFRPTSTGVMPNNGQDSGTLSTQLNNNPAAAVGATASEDLATFLLPRILRSASSLEATLLSMPAHREPDLLQNATSKLWRERRRLLTQLEQLLAVVIRSLAASAVRVDWADRDSVTRGGIGKAREIIQQIMGLLKAVLPSGLGNAPSFPVSHVMLAGPSARAQQMDPFDAPQPSTIVVRSELHARALTITSMRVLHQAVNCSPFVRDLAPSIVDLLMETWPAPPSTFDHEHGEVNSDGHPVIPSNTQRKDKGKGKMTRLDHVAQARLASARITAASLDLACMFIEQPVGSFESSTRKLFLACVACEQLRAQLTETLNSGRLGDADDPSGMGDDEGILNTQESRHRRHESLAVLWGYLWRIREDSDGLEGNDADTLSSFFDLEISRNAEGITRQLMLTDMDDDQALRIACIFAANLYLQSVTACSKPHAPELESVGRTWDDLRGLSELDGDTPIELKGRLAYLSHSATLARETLLRLVNAIDTTNSLESEILATGHLGKRKRTDGDDSHQQPHPSSDMGPMDVDGMPPATNGTRQKRVKVPWKQAVMRILEMRLTGEKLDLVEAGPEKMMAMLTEHISSTDISKSFGSLQLIGLLACARDGSISFGPASDDPFHEPEPSCCFCDAWTSGVTCSTEFETRGGQRTLTDAPLKALRSAALLPYDPLIALTATTLTKIKDRRRLAYLKTVPRVLRHSRAAASALRLDYPSQDAIMRLVWTEMKAASRSARLVAGRVLVAVVQAHQIVDPSASFVTLLFRRVDSFLASDKASVIETTMIAVSEIARVATPQGLLECACLERLIAKMGHSNILLKGAARIHLEAIAAYREIKPYVLVQPHFPSIAPLFVSSETSSPAILRGVVDCFQQSREVILSLTRDHTLPSMVAKKQKTLLASIARASNMSMSHMLVFDAAAILEYLYMLPLSDETRSGLEFLLGEIKAAGAGMESLTLPTLLGSIKVSLVYRLALQLGDEDPNVSAQAERALKTVERTCQGASDKVELGVVLKSSIVGILSHMNRGLNESATHKPLREKQRIIRSLEAVTIKVGPAIAGFSPQIMATLQSALDVPGLRGVTVKAFKSFITSLKFAEVGPFIGPTTATFVRLWNEFTPVEKVLARETIDYIVLQNSDGLANFVRDIADLRGIPELANASRRLREIRQTWDFRKQVNHLLTRIASENDVVTLQALKEFKTLVDKNRSSHAQLWSGDAFDKLIGSIIKVLFAAAVRDGPDNQQIRNHAFECLGILGALDPDRIELPPADPPTIVLENFNNPEESISFALHLIQNLLVGAYRSTNDTKHQEFLAFAIQELLQFCGFNESLVNPDASEEVDPKIRARWEALPEVILETCGPLLNTRFKVNEPSGRIASYPIYKSTSSYREWIRTFANDLIAKLRDTTVQRIFRAFSPVLHLEDIAVAQHLLPHLVLNTLISGESVDCDRIREELEMVLSDQVSPTEQLSEHSRLLTSQTVFDLMDHLSRFITLARKRQSELRSLARHSGKRKASSEKDLQPALGRVQRLLLGIPHILVGQAALTCKAYARSLLNFESHIVAQRKNRDESEHGELQEYYENLHECYANLEEPDGMEGISTRIVAPSILHQIREHESTGRWTSAQSCWEVKLQQKPDEPANHIGLLRCLRNLGHYDSMRTHIVGIMHSRGDETDWDRILAPYNIEASLFISDWAAVEDALRIPDIDGPEVAFGRVISAMQVGSPEQLALAFFDAREQLGRPIVAAGRESYRRVYDSIVNLHILYELEVISRKRKECSGDVPADLLRTLRRWIGATSPSFRAREPILNMRRTALRLVPTESARSEIAELWLETCKIARKAGHMQTAYSAILQARDLNAEFVFLQSSKLLRETDQPYKAIQDIDNALKSKIPANIASKEWADDPNNPVVSPDGLPTPLAKASLRRARWMHESGRLEHNDIIRAYLEAGKLAPRWESPHYYLGRYWDARTEDLATRHQTPTTFDLSCKIETIRCFSAALQHGTKYIYQAMPRMLTVWLEFSEIPTAVEIEEELRKNPNANFVGKRYELQQTLTSIHSIIKKSTRRLPTYQWLTVLPQLVSRILHPNRSAAAVLDEILIRVLCAYPHHGLWAMASGARSNHKRRAKRNLQVLDRAKGVTTPPTSVRELIAKQRIDVTHVGRLIDEGLRLVDGMLALCDYDLGKETKSTMSLEAICPTLHAAVPSALIIPLQSSLTASLPSISAESAMHKPFPDHQVTFRGFDDAIQIMASLQKPRKLTIIGDDGRQYPFLCKPKDDLRKDARMMEFESMLVKLLKKDSEARNRRLNIRSYAVVPLNEENGLIEWVPHTVVIRSILNKLYSSRGIAGWSPELKRIFDTIRNDPKTIGERYTTEVLKGFPSVFHEWFLETFPEPSAWLRARLAYARTNAVMCMIGFMLGLGDRHMENILVDATTGDTVHVDFNCLFDRGRTFEVPEQVPFRLTHNIVDGMGVSGIEGVYRHAAEITLRILRSNTDSLMSVLETFLHDPLVDWVPTQRRGKPVGASELENFTKNKAKDSLGPISNKLRGLQVVSAPTSLGAKEVSVGEQVERLIREARDPKNLGSMYPGWAPWY